MASRNRELLNTALKFCQARLCPPNIGQIAAEAALDSPPEYSQYIYNSFLERRNYLVKALNEIPSVFSPVPKGAFYTMARLPVDDAEKFAMWMLQSFEHNKQTVMLAPGSGFYTTAGSGKQEVRIAYVLNIPDLKNAMECLKLGLEQYPGRITL
jgi:aspartate aminotransferase